MKVTIEFNNRSKKVFENVNYINEGFTVKKDKLKEYIEIIFIEEDEEDITINKEDIKRISTYEEYRNGVESWRTSKQ